MQSPTPVLKDLVLVGGGHSHVAVLKHFGMTPLPGVRVTVISRDVETPYSGMLPGYVAGHYDRRDTHVDLRPLCRFAGARLYHDSVVGLDLEGRRVLCDGRPPVAYDVLSLNVGSTPRSRGIRGAHEHALPVKPVDRFVEGWRALVREIEAGPRDSIDVVVVGGGAGGVELTLATRHRLDDLLDPGAPGVRFHIVTDSGRILAGHARGVTRRFRRILEERGVEVHTGQRVAEVTPDGVRCDSGLELAADRTILVTDGAPPEWIADTGLATDDRGFVAVEPTLRSSSHPQVFAAGDVAMVRGFPRPRAGVFAVRQGPPLARNLRRALQDRPLRPHRPQKRFLSLISTGDRCAVASWGPFSMEGRWLWTVKDWIDRRWMDQWRDLPEMESGADGTWRSASEPDGVAGAVATDPSRRELLERLAADPMRCGGCGAKVGATVLERALRRVRGHDPDPPSGSETPAAASAPTPKSPVDRGTVTASVDRGTVIGLTAPDDAAVVRVPDGHVAVQSVDFFRPFVDDPHLFARVAAVHALGDLWAMGAEPRWALAVATLPLAPEEKMEEELVQLLTGATKVLTEAGAELVGGHTGEGAELAFGLQVTGVARPEDLLRKGGLRPGDRLVLTQGLGTGVLFAADMRGRARAPWVETALERMLQPAAEAARVLRHHGATACTDVTGFGLVGHLLEMLEASGVGACVELGAVPVLEGAATCVSQGIASSLHPDNLRLRRAVEVDGAGAEEPTFALLFDPQTAGGLLAGVASERTESCVEALREAGYADSAVVGEAVEAPAGDVRIRVAP